MYYLMVIWHLSHLAVSTFNVHLSINDSLDYDNLNGCSLHSVYIFMKNTEDSGFASPALGSAHFHVSWLSDFIFYHKPLYKSLPNHFSIYSKPSYPQKVVLHSITARFCLRYYYSAIWLPFSNLQTWSRDTNWMITVTHCMMGAT